MLLKLAHGRLAFMLQHSQAQFQNYAALAVIAFMPAMSSLIEGPIELHTYMDFQ